ncbi:uncharacterized protein LOC125288529 isoform X1 [Alosa alosa]|uniref:uncharacterized protein LOC125288529 isoform X1 n=1 Tax=Alosa alosa TaxID=278164 RepID=UPI0020151B48|nr:uncharacterized protein LOC125288529 isoform X1 [Alosa alosa]
MDREVVLEGLSAVLGVSIRLLSDGDSGNADVLTVEKFLAAAWFGYDMLKCLDPVSALAKYFASFFIADTPGGEQSGAEEESANSALRKELFINEKEFFDPKYDYDFTNTTDSSACKRGDEPYKRPCGWNRIALKVKGKYEDDVWLGPDGWRSSSAPGEWPVSFHGTTIDGAKGIIQSGYKTGPREAYGRGIYSTPDIDVAERDGYAKTFTSKNTGKTYKIVLQNRVNPEHRKICVKENYWLVPVPGGTSAEREREIVNSAIRPYGLLLK